MAEGDKATEVVVVRWINELLLLEGGNPYMFLGISLLNRRRCMLDSTQITRRIMFIYQILRSNRLSL